MRHVHPSQLPPANSLPRLSGFIPTRVSRAVTYIPPETIAFLSLSRLIYVGDVVRFGIYDTGVFFQLGYGSIYALYGVVLKL